MSQRIINLTETPGPREIPSSVQTGVRADRGFRLRATEDGRWSYEIRRTHGMSFGGPFASTALACQKAEAVVLALAEKKIAV